MALIHFIRDVSSVLAVCKLIVASPKSSAQPAVASYPGRVGGEKRPGIDCLRMRGQFRYISIKL